MENLTGGTPPVRYLLCVVPCKLYFTTVSTTGLNFKLMLRISVSMRSSFGFAVRRESASMPKVMYFSPFSPSLRLWKPWKTEKTVYTPFPQPALTLFFLSDFLPI